MRQLRSYPFARHALLSGQLLDEVGSDGGEQGVGGEVAVGQAWDLLQYGLEQAVPPHVMPGLVRTAAPAFLQGQREAAVVEFEAQDGVKQGGYALVWWGGGPQGWRAGFDGVPDRFESCLVQRTEQPGTVTEGPEE